MLHSQLLPDRSWSSSQGWDEVPDAIPELADTLSCWSAQPPPSPGSCPADPSSKYTQAAPCNEKSFNQEQQQPGVADMEVDVSELVITVGPAPLVAATSGVIS